MIEYKRVERNDTKMNKYEEAKRLLQKYEQQEVLKELEKNQKEELIEQVLHLDFEKIETAKRRIEEKEDFQEDKIESIPYVDLQNLSKEEKEKYEQIGNNIIKKGKYAVVTMAGGQRYKTWSYTVQKELL